ncbi:ABC transporter permease [Cryptosporangium sp. NPDC051539]|uniref:ABC transporter permease n=1 Tax=Cryptosporangium sp. NPDC051539 TaxID=3363962 RepID=UPI0037A61EF0
MKSPLAGVLGGSRFVALGVAVVVALALLLVPFAVVIATSFSDNAFALFPPEGFTFDWYRTVLTSPDWGQAAWLSIWISALATLIATVFGLGGALALARLRRRGLARVVRTLFIAPIALPPVAYAVGLYGINLDVPVLYGTFTPLVLGEAVLALPYVFVVVSGAVGRLDPALRQAAATMGAPWPMVLLRVELPLIAGSVFAGALFAFVTAFDDVVLAVFVAPLGSTTLPLLMLNQSQESVTPELTAASTLVSLAALLVLGVGNLFTRRRSAPASRPAPVEATA